MSGPRRILHVFRAPLGGLFRHVLDVARGQIARGHAVGIFCDSTTGGVRADETLADLRDPRINLVAANLRNLPPVTIVNAQIDPLRSDGETLAAALNQAGDRVEQRTFPGVTHEFFGMGKVVRGAADANAYAIDRLRVAFSQ